MKKPIEFLSEAETEYLSALAWYRERSPAAAIKLETEFNRSIKQIRETPWRWAPYLRDCRRFLLHQFPFAIVYQDTPTVIRVVAVAHGHRRPGYWKDRT
jgi:toxin ParE2